MKVWQMVKVSKETLLGLNKLLDENPLLRQDDNVYDDLIKVLIKRHLEDSQNAGSEKVEI